MAHWDVQAQRTRKNPRKNIWEELDQQHFARDAPDISALLERRAAVGISHKPNPRACLLR